jgi:hypothetical protein
VKISDVFAALKAWSNFRLMVLAGSVVTLLSLFAGALYVQAAISGSQPEAETRTEESGRNVSDLRGSINTPEGPEPSPSAPPSPVGGLARATDNEPAAVDSGEDFAIACNNLNAVPGGTSPPPVSCRITSYNGFSSRVELSCASMPPELGCRFSPRSASPPANGTVGVQLQLSSARVAPGSYLFQVVGRSGNKANSYSFPIGIAAPAPTTQTPSPQPVVATPVPVPLPTPLPTPTLPAEPTFTIACTLAPAPESAIDRLIWSLTQGSKGAIKCLVTPKNGFDEEVTLTLANVSDEVVVHNFDPPILRFIDGTASFVDLNFELGALETGKEYVFDVTGTSASKTLVKRVVLTVTE